MSGCCKDQNTKIYTSNWYYDGSYLPKTGIAPEDNGNTVLTKIENYLSSNVNIGILPGTGIGVTQSGNNFTITNSAPNITQLLSLSGNTLSLSGGGGSITLPSPPSTQVNSDWDAVSGVAKILNKPVIPANQTLTYTAGTGELSISNGNTVTIPFNAYTAGTGINITGTTITNTSPNESRSLSISGSQLTLSGLGGNTVNLPTNDGSETKVQAGTAITVTGIGTAANPYVVSNSAPNQDQAMSLSGNVLSLTRTTGGSPYNVTLPTAPTPDGSETKVTAGTGISVTGTGTTANPYIVVNSSPNVAQTLLYTSSTGALTITGTGGNTVNLTNFYTSDGSLTSSRTVTLGNTTLDFTGTTASLHFSNNGTGSNGLSLTSDSKFLALNAPNSNITFRTTNSGSPTYWDTSNLTAARTLKTPDANGTIALSVNNVAADSTGNIAVSTGGDLELNSYHFSESTISGSEGIETNGGLATGETQYVATSFTALPSKLTYIVGGVSNLTITFPDPSSWFNSLLVFKILSERTITFAGGTVYQNGIWNGIEIPANTDVYLLVKASYNSLDDLNVWEIIDLHKIDNTLLFST